VKMATPLATCTEEEQRSEGVKTHPKFIDE
jgi:hypothetical protein